MRRRRFRSGSGLRGLVKWLDVSVFVSDGRSADGKAPKKRDVYAPFSEKRVNLHPALIWNGVFAAIPAM